MIKIVTAYVLGVIAIFVAVIVIGIAFYFCIPIIENVFKDWEWKVNKRYEDRRKDRDKR